MLSAEALQIWQAFQQAVEIKLRPHGELAVCQGWGGKLCGFSLRIAGLLHIAQWGEQAFVVNEETMQSALQIANLLIPHALAIYELGGADLTLQDAKSVLAWIQAKRLTTFTQSDIINGLRGRSRGKSEHINKALKLLLARNFLKIQRQTNERKPTLIYHFNPAIMESNSNHQ